MYCENLYCELKIEDLQVIVYDPSKNWSTVGKFASRQSKLIESRKVTEEILQNQVAA